MTVTINGTTGIAGVDGSAATPAVQGADTNTGVFYGTDIVAISTGGTERVRVNASGQAEFTAGTAALPAITATGDTNTGVFFPAADTIAFAEGGAESMRIDANGDLLVGKTTTSALVVGGLMTHNGEATLSTDAASPDDGPSLQIINLNASVVNGYRFASFRVGAAATQIGTITKASATTVAYNTSSDYRLKENVQPMQNALAVISALKPSTYDWIGHSESGEGFIAHELQEIIPIAVTGVKDAVNEDGSINAQGVDYSKIVVHLVAAIQEQQAMITALTARITALEVTP